MGLINYLDNLDKSIFLFLNGLNHPLLDPVFIFITERFTWVPLYFLFIYFIYRAHGSKSLLILLFISLLITAADQTSSGVLKPLVQRLRPCHNPELMSKIHIPHGCGGQYGFVSSHAANTFGLALFLFLLFKRKKVWLLTFLWAGIVSYSRIYLGAHYPGDIICGALVGFFWAWGCYLSLQKLKLLRTA